MRAMKHLHAGALVLVLFAAAGAHGQTVKLSGREFLPVRQVTGEQYDVVLDVAAPSAPAKRFRVAFAHGPKGRYEVVFGDKSTELARVVKDVRTVLARNGAASLPRPLKHLTLRRLEDLVVVMANGAVVCRATDSALKGGWVLMQTGPGMPQATKATIRRREPVFFSDDFMVTKEEAKSDRGWRPVSGTWECKSVRPENVATSKAYTTRSANPFAYLGVPAPRDEFALSVRGEDWWSGYRYRASVKCLAEGAAGLAFGCEGADTFWLFRLECRGRFALPSRLQLVRVDRGRRRVVAERFVRARFGHWFSLGAEVYHGRVRLSFLGSPVMDVADRRITGGRIGLYAEGPRGAAFDDVEVSELGRLRFDRSQDLASSGRQVSGTWRAEGGRNGSPTRFVPEGRNGLLLFGDERWTGGAVTAEVRPGSRGAFGVVAGADGDSAYLVALMPRGKGALLSRDNGREKVLAKFSYEHRRNEWCRVGLNLSEQGVVSAHVGGGLVARARVSGRPRGRIGLFTTDARGAAFRNLVANRSPRLLAAHQIGNAVFLSDDYMSSWATEQGQWIPNDGIDRARSMSGYNFTGANNFWRKGDYYGDYVMLLPLTIMSQAAASAAGVQPPPVNTPITGSLALHFCLRSGDLHSGYSAVAVARQPGVYDVELRHRSRVVTTVRGVRPSADANEIRIYNSGQYIWAKLGGRELFSYKKPDTGSGTRVAAVRSGPVDFNRLALYAENLDDSSFERASVNWRIVGDWQITNRFRCDPRWSWMGVDSLRGYSAMWRRREFPGDLTVTLYASMKMRSSGTYYCPSDLNLTLAADRESPASGYSFLVGGWANSKTAILRNGKVVAETKGPYLPNTRDGYPASAMLHRRWFYVKVRRKGPTLQLYLDNRKYLEYTDPQPLRGGKAAVWTQEQSIMVARTQFFYSKAVMPKQTVAAPAKTAVELPPARLPPLDVVCRNRTGYFFDFETGTQGWPASVRGAGNAMAARDTRATGSRGGRASLKLVNAECSGRFLTAIPVKKVNLLACPVLSFDYKIPRDVQVNLYFDVGASKTARRRSVPWVRVRRGGRQRWRADRARALSVAARTYFIALSGPSSSTEGVKLAGGFPNARADNRWRKASVNLAQMMRRFYPTESTVHAENFRLGFDHRGTYEVAGMGGNARGASYHIDNFLLVAAGDGRPVFRWRPYATSHTGYASCVTDRNDSDPGQRPNLRVPHLSPEVKRPGLRYLHVRPIVTKARQVVPAAHVPFYDIGPELEAPGISPADRSKWGGNPIRMHFREAQVAALDASSVIMNVGGAEVHLDGRVLSMDWAKAVLTLDPSQLPVQFENAAIVNCSLKLRTFAQSTPKTVTWQYVASSALDKTPPGAVAVEGQYETDDFEQHRDNWHASSYAACGIDKTTAKTGKGSLRIFNSRDGGNFLVHRTFEGRRLGECPIIEFDYRAGPKVRPDLVIRGAGTLTFKLFDRTPQFRVGTVPNAVADGKWHSASVDVFGALWDSDRRALCSRLSSIGFGDYGWQSSREGDCYHIDNFRVIPVASCRDGLELKWSANDPLGVAGCAFKWSAKAEDEPPKHIMATGDTLRVDKLPEGRQYLHVRAVDRAGNWGPARHYAYIIDNKPPVVTAGNISPRPGRKIAPRRFTVTIKDAYGPDPASLRLTVDGKALTLWSATLRSARRPQISWDLGLTPEDIRPIPNGKVLNFSLSGVRDFAGNTVEPITGSWTMDYKQDRMPPQRVEFTPKSAPVAFAKRFDSSTDGASATGHIRVERVLDTPTASHVLRMTPVVLTARSALFRGAAFDLATTGIIRMDVNLPQTTTYLDLFIYGQGFTCKLRMADPLPNEPTPGTRVVQDGFTYLGPMNGVRSGTGWHTQWIDLYPLVRRAFPNLRSYRVRFIRIGRLGAPYNPARNVRLDNLSVYGYGDRQMRLELRSRDVTGLSGYAISVSKSATALPKKQIDHRGDTLTRTLTPGTWYVVGYACDNNGNWSQTRGTFPYIVK